MLHVPPAQKVVLSVALTGVCLLGLPTRLFAEKIPFSKTFERSGYKQVACRKGVTAYRNEGSNFLRMGAEGRLEASPAQVKAALLDYIRHAGTMPRLSVSRVLLRGRNWLLVYQRLRLPVVSDRDVVQRITWGEAGGVTWIRFLTAPGKGPARPSGVVRMTHHNGYWQLKPTAGGRATLARFQVSTRMGGWMPSWMAKPHAGKDLPELYQALGRLIKKRAVAASARRASQK